MRQHRKKRVIQNQDSVKIKRKNLIYNKPISKCNICFTYADGIYGV